MNFKNKKGITLVALVITIIVLLILAGVALNLVLGEDGITNRAVNAGKTQNIAGAKEKLELEVANLAGEYYQAKYVNNSLPEGVDTVGEYVLSKLNENYPTGEFVDGYEISVSGSTVTLTATEGSDGTSVEGTITDDGKITFEQIVIGSSTGGSTNTATNTSTNTTSNTASNTTENTTGGGSTGTATLADTSYVGYYANVDGVWGIIYADLQKGVPNSSPWGNSDGAYTLPTLEEGESYKSYTVSVLTSTSGLTTFGGYTSANANTGVISLASGSTGKDRFYVMTTTDESGTYTWANACAKTAGTTNKWVLPTKEQWSMFGSAFGIASSNYGTQTGGYGLNNYYWSSTEYYTGGAWLANFGNGCMNGIDKTCSLYVRLSTTF